MHQVKVTHKRWYLQYKLLQYVYNIESCKMQVQTFLINIKVSCLHANVSGFLIVCRLLYFWGLSSVDENIL